MCGPHARAIAASRTSFGSCCDEPQHALAGRLIALRVPAGLAHDVVFLDHLFAEQAQHLDHVGVAHRELAKLGEHTLAGILGLAARALERGLDLRERLARAEIDPLLAKPQRVNVIVPRARMDRALEVALERDARGIPREHAVERVTDRVLHEVVDVQVVDRATRVRDQPCARSGVALGRARYRSSVAWASNASIHSSDGTNGDPAVPLRVSERHRHL